MSLPAGTVPPFEARNSLTLRVQEADVKILLGTVHVRATLEALASRLHLVNMELSFRTLALLPTQYQKRTF